MRNSQPHRKTIASGNLDHGDARSDGLCLRLTKTVWLVIWLGLATLLVFPPITLVSFFSRTGSSMFHLARLWARIICSVTGV